MPDDDAPALDTRPLHETADTVLVTLAAAHTWMEAVGSDGAAEAQREATEYLLDARQTHPAVDGYPERWRRRTRSSGLDVTAHVARSGGRRRGPARVERDCEDCLSMGPCGPSCEYAHIFRRGA